MKRKILTDTSFLISCVEFKINWQKEIRRILDENFEIKASPVWSDDAWYLNQQDCNLIKNHGPYSIIEGEA